MVQYVTTFYHLFHIGDGPLLFGDKVKTQYQDLIELFLPEYAQ